MNALKTLSEKAWLLGLIFLLALAASDNWHNPNHPAAGGSKQIAAPGVVATDGAAS